MKCKVLPHARVVMTTDGSNQLFIDTGKEVLPISFDPALAPEGSIGYVEHRITETMPATIIYNHNPYDNGGDRYCFDAPDFAGGDHADCYMYINDSKYFVSGIGDDYYGWTRHVSGPIRGASIGGEYLANYINAVYWNTYIDGPAPESITLRFENVEDITHHISEEYMPQSYQDLPGLAEMLSTGGITAVKKAEYTFEVWDEDKTAQTYLSIDQGADSLLGIGKTATVHLDGVDYESTMIFIDHMGGRPIIGNPAVVDESLEDNGEPFAIFINSYDDIICRVRGTDEKHVVGVTINGTTMKSNRINLGAYPLAEIIITLANQGGGMTEFESPILEQFWYTINSVAGTDVHLWMSVDTYHFDIGGVTLTHTGDHCSQVSFGFLMLNPVSGEANMVNIAIVRTSSTSVAVFVKVT